MRAPPTTAETEECVTSAGISAITAPTANACESSRGPTASVRMSSVAPTIVTRTVAAATIPRSDQGEAVCVAATMAPRRHAKRGGDHRNAAALRRWRLVRRACVRSRQRVAREQGTQPQNQNEGEQRGADGDGQRKPEPRQRLSKSRHRRRQATPVRNRSCICTTPTGLPCCTTNIAVILDELRISSASLANCSS